MRYAEEWSLIVLLQQKEYQVEPEDASGVVHKQNSPGHLKPVLSGLSKRGEPEKMSKQGGPPAYALRYLSHL